MLQSKKRLHYPRNHSRGRLWHRVTVGPERCRACKDKYIDTTSHSEPTEQWICFSFLWLHSQCSAGKFNLTWCKDENLLVNWLKVHKIIVQCMKHISIKMAWSTVRAASQVTDLQLLSRQDEKHVLVLYYFILQNRTSSLPYRSYREEGYFVIEP